MARPRKIKGSLTMTSRKNPAVDSAAEDARDKRLGIKQTPQEEAAELKKSAPAPKKVGAGNKPSPAAKAAMAAVRARKAKNDNTPSMISTMSQAAKRFTGSGK